MIVYILQVSICLAFFYVFYHFALRRETLFHGNRFYLLITLLLSFFLPLINISVQAWNADNAVLQAPVYIGTYLQNFENIAVKPEVSNFSWWQIVQILYWSGVIFMSSRLLLALRSILYLKSKSQKIHIEMAACVSSPEIKTPFSFWNFIFIPANHQYTDVELKEVICHEHAHLAGRHSLDILLIEVASILLWFNPFVYLYKNALKDIHEFIADAAVIRNNSWELYAKFLVAQQYTGLQNRLSNQLIYSQLKNRLIMMTQKPSSWIAKWKYTGALPLLLLALLIFSFRPKERETPILAEQTEDTSAAVKDGNTEKPIFPGCEKLNLMEIEDCSHKKLFEYVADHLQYPESMKTAGIEGKVYVTFTITDKGLVSAVRVTKSLNPSADAAAMDVVNSMNDNVGKWTPGTKEGIPVNMDMVLPISFVLGIDKTAQEQVPQEPYSYVERMPQYPDGQDAMYKFVYENLKYPELAKQKKVSGTVIIQFVVSKDGDIQDAKVVRGIGSGCDEEALRVVNLMPKWSPGMHNGRFVPVAFTLPIKFVLQSGEKN